MIGTRPQGVLDGSHPSFSDLMAEQLRHTPWLALSIAIHALGVGLLMLLPGESVAKKDSFVAIHTAEAEEPLPEEKAAPEDKPEPEEATEPMLQDVDLQHEAASEVDDGDWGASFTDDDLGETMSAFDSNAWNTAIGLGGGAGGKFSGRRGGRASLATRGGRETARAIEMALDWLARHQDEDGRWDADDFMKHDESGEPCDGPGSAVHDVGMTGLALLAFLGDGSTLRSGPYRDNVKSAVRWLREQQDGATGLFGGSISHDFVYDHAIATLAMVEAYGLSEYTVLRKYAQGGLRYLETHRNPYMVWRYQPRDNDNDTSVTGWCVMAYKSAQDFGLLVDETAMRNSAVWFDQVTDPLTGRCGYTRRGEVSSRHAGDHQRRFPPGKGEALTAVGLLCRFFLGQDPEQSEVLARAAESISKKPPVQDWSADPGAVDFYYWYYASYALYQMGGRWWTRWSEELGKAVLHNQRKDGNFAGSWDPVDVWGADGGRVYSTATLALTLEAYYRYTRVLLRRARPRCVRPAPALRRFVAKDGKAS